MSDTTKYKLAQKIVQPVCNNFGPLTYSNSYLLAMAFFVILPIPLPKYKTSNASNVDKSTDIRTNVYRVTQKWHHFVRLNFTKY